MTVVAEIPTAPRNGAPVRFRTLTPGDRSRFTEVFDGLGPQSRYMRYHGVKPVLSEREIRYFTDVDHHDHEALLAVVGDETVGVVRFVRRDDDPRSADVALEVVDRWQRQGLGSALLGRIARRARHEGVDRFFASVLQSNESMLATIRSLRAPWVTTSRSGPVVEIEVTIASGHGTK
jgi:GNAT superfamily N-acetyltransferase